MDLNYTKIVTMIMKGEALQPVLDAMAEYLQAALVVSSDEMDIIAFTRTVPARDPYWQQALHEGYCSNEMLNRIYESPLVKDLHRTLNITGGNSYSPDNVTLKYYISLPRDAFRYGIAVVAFPLENRFEKHRQDLLLSFACLVKNAYLRPETLPLAFSYRNYQSILQRLLNQDNEQAFDEEARASIKVDNADFDHIQVLVFSPEFQEISDVFLYSLAGRICSLLGNEYATAYKGSIVTIFQSQKMTETCTEQLRQLAKQSNAKIGISWDFSGKEAVWQHYRQAVFSIEMARKLSASGQIFTYDEMYIYALVEKCRKQEHWADVQHPVLTLLKNYDAKYDACLYDTLYCLLKCGMNSPLAAKKLGIHKSSLYHRMEILKELIPDILTKSAEWQTSVMLSFDLACNKAVPPVDLA